MGAAAAAPHSHYIYTTSVCQGLIDATDLIERREDEPHDKLQPEALTVKHHHQRHRRQGRDVDQETDKQVCEEVHRLMNNSVGTPPQNNIETREYDQLLALVSFLVILIVFEPSNYNRG